MIAKGKATCMTSVWLGLGHRHRTIVFKGTVSHCYCWAVIDIHSSLGEVPTKVYSTTFDKAVLAIMLVYESDGQALCKCTLGIQPT